MELNSKLKILNSKLTQMLKTQNSKRHDSRTSEAQMSLFCHLNFEFWIYLGFGV